MRPKTELRQTLLSLIFYNDAHATRLFQTHLPAENIVRVSVIVPSLNEEKTLPRCLNAIYDRNPDLDIEVIVVDDGSTDGTQAFLSSTARPGFKHMRHPVNRGKGAAIRTGLKEASGDVVIIQDADLEYDPADYKTVLAPIFSGRADVVYGSRALGKRNARSYRRYYWGGRFLSWWTNLLFGSRLTDEPTCYKAFKTSLLKDLDLQCRGFEFCPEVTAKVLNRGIPIVEVPISYNPRRIEEGKKIRWQDGVIALWTLLKFRASGPNTRTPRPAGKHRERLRALLWTALVVGAAARFSFASWLGEKIYQPDEGSYVHLGHNLSDRGVFGTLDKPEADRPPALPFLIAGVSSVAGPGLLAPRLASATLSLISIGLLFLYGRDTLGEAPALLASAMMAVYPFFIYWSGILTTETLTVFMLLLALWLTDEAASRPRIWKTVLAGTCWGLLVLTRTQNILFLPVAAAWSGMKTRGTRGLAATAILLACAAIPVAAWGLRNKRRIGAFTLDTHGGYTFLIRTMFHDEDHKDTSVAEEALERTEIYRQVQNLSPAEKDRRYFHEALAFIRAHPALYLYNSARNFWQLWRFYPRTDKIDGAGSPYLDRSRGLFVGISLLTEPWLAIFGLAGVFAAWKSRRPLFLPLSYIVLMTAVHTFVIAQMRYRIPLMPLVILLAAYGGLSILQKDPL